MKKKLVIAAVIFVGLIITTTIVLQNHKPLAQPQTSDRYNKILTINGHILYIDIARSTAEMMQGLSGRPSMDVNQGMLFDFRPQPPQVRTFWMKGMDFGLDFIWINKGTIVDITANVPPPQSDSNNLPSYKPSAAVDEVLEVNAGWAGKNNVKVGDQIIF